MDNLLISLVSILVGVGATILASRYYYRRSVDKELTPFVQFQSNVLDHIDQDVKSDLDIRYKTFKVERLQQVQFLIANTGERAIKELIRPLKLEIGGEVTIMDANLLHIHPEGREVNLKIEKEKNTVEFDFPLLNKDEFFVVKFLINGAPKTSDYNFTIVADDLPPKLKQQRLSYRQIEKEQPKEKESKFGFGEFGVGLFSLLLALSLAMLAYYSGDKSIPEIVNPAFTWVNFIPFLSIASWLAYVVAGILGVLAFALMWGAFGEFEFPKSKKFVLPNDLASASLGTEFFYSEPELRKAIAANNAINSDS